MRRQFDTLQSSVKKYRAKSQMAINGLNNVIQQANLIAELPNVESKWKYIATYMGLQQEGNNSFYNTFVPLNNDILFLLRNGNHSNANPELYNRHEKLGRPDKRFVVCFHRGNFSNTTTNFLEAEHHTILYPINSLDTEQDVIAYCQAYITLFQYGDTTFPQLLTTDDSGQGEENSNDASGNIIHESKKIMMTEAQLHYIIHEAIKENLYI